MLLPFHERVALHEAGVGAADKAEHLLALVGVAVALLDFLHGMADGVAFLEDKAVDVGNIVDGFAAETPALQAERVDSGIGNGVACRLDKGRDVLVDKRAPGGDDVRAYVDKLQAGCLATKDDVVAQHDMTRQGGVVGQDAVAAHYAVVRHMDVCHEQVVAADYGAARGRSAAVDGAALADDVVVANLAGGVLSGKLQVLRHCRDDRAGEDVAVLADACTGIDNHVGFDDRVVADDHIVADGGEIAYRDVAAEACVGMYVVQLHFLVDINYKVLRPV